MEKSELTQKLSAFWNETLTGDGKQFNFSVQDVIELYCEIRAKEDELTVRKGQHLLGGKKSLAEVRLKNVKSLKFALSETYLILTGDEAGVAKLERWYNKSRQCNVEAETKVKVENVKKVKDTAAETYVGLPKSKEFLALSSRLYRDGVWNGDIKKTDIPEDNLRSFYYILGCDEEILLAMKGNREIALNWEDRLSGVVKSRLLLKEYFNFNFRKDIQVEFILWKTAIRQLFAKEFRQLEKSLRVAKSESAFTAAYHNLVCFWNKFSFLSRNTTESGAVLNLTNEHLPREYHFVCSERQIEIFGMLDQLENNGYDKQFFSRLRNIVKDTGCRSVVVNAKHYRALMSGLYGILHRKVVVMQQDENGRIFFCKAI